MRIFRTRRGTLEDKLKPYVDGQNLPHILECVYKYERLNLEKIKKLNKIKTIETNRISGALKQTINAHGPITKQFIGSATKRIYGGLLDEVKKLELSKSVLISESKPNWKIIGAVMIICFIIVAILVHK